MVLAIFVSGTIGPHEGHGYDQEVVTNPTMILESIFGPVQDFGDEQGYSDGPLSVGIGGCIF